MTRYHLSTTWPRIWLLAFDSTLHAGKTWVSGAARGRGERGEPRVFQRFAGREAFSRRDLSEAAAVISRSRAEPGQKRTRRDWEESKQARAEGDGLAGGKG
eukprot:7471-Rhodomonas_salina.3